MNEKKNKTRPYGNYFFEEDGEIFGSFGDDRKYFKLKDGHLYHRLTKEEDYRILAKDFEKTLEGRVE